MSRKKPAPKPKTPTGKQSARPAPAAPDDRKKLWITIVALAALTWFAFYPSLKCEFTNWDDGTYVTENPGIWKFDSESIRKIFINPDKKDSDPWYKLFPDVSLNYHPLTIVTLAFDYSLGKLDPYYYHLNNVLLHIVNTVLIFLFMQQLIRGYNRRAPAEWFRPDPFVVALISAFFWGIHPMRVESVTWVAERKDVMYMLFFLLSMMSYIRFLDEKKIKWLAFSFLAFIASCLSKGMGVVLPVALMLIDWLYGEIRSPRQAIQSLLPKIPFFAASLFFGVLAFKIQSQGAIAAMGTFTLFQRLTFGCYGFIMYIWKMLLPINLSAFYPYPFTDAQGNIPGIYYASPFIVLCMALAVGFLYFKRPSLGKPLAFGMLFYFLTVALVLQFVSVGSVIMADRYAYASYTGLFFLLGFFADYLRRQVSDAVWKMTAAGLAAVVLYFSFLTYERTKVWTNAETLWTDAMNQFPFIEIAYENRGVYYKDHNQLDKMLVDYEFVTQKLNSKNEKIWSNLGNLYGLMKQFDKSLAAYSRAIELNPNNSSTYLNRAITFSMMGQYAQSLPDFDKSIELAPEVALTYKNRAYTLMQLGKFDQSITDYDLALRLNEYDTLSFLNRGISKFNAKRYADALADFKTYIGMAPNNPQAYYNASISANGLGQYAEALQFALTAQKLGQPVGEAYLNELKMKAK